MFPTFWTLAVYWYSYSSLKWINYLKRNIDTGNITRARTKIGTRGEVGTVTGDITGVINGARSVSGKDTSKQIFQVLLNCMIWVGKSHFKINSCTPFSLYLTSKSIVFISKFEIKCFCHYSWSINYIRIFCCSCH